MPMQSLRSFEPANLLLRALTRPEDAAHLGESAWNEVIRAGRLSRLLGTLRHRLALADALQAVPARVRRHLDSDFMLARFWQQAARHQLRDLALLLRPLGISAVVLKGAAYALQELEHSQGRFLSDVDLMVPFEQLAAAERLLNEAGWAFEALDPYDERYYREWVHELPAMRCPGYYLELDLHHAILPRTGRVQPDTRALFRDAVAIPGSGLSVLCPADQVLHACAHLAQDSDLTDRLRDLIDVDALVRKYAALPGFWDALMEHARAHGLGRSLWYCLRYCRRWLYTPIPQEVEEHLTEFEPGCGIARWMDWMVSRALLPPHPDAGRPLSARLASNLLFARSHWLRMPLPLLIRHTTVKALRRYRAGLPQPRGA
jgi:hypothetical protein